MTAAISVFGPVKDFGTTRVLDHLDLTVRTGEVHGFLGPNGTGKTTTIRILLGLLRNDGGAATVLGEHPGRDAVTLHRRLAYVPIRPRHQDSDVDRTQQSPQLVSRAWGALDQEPDFCLVVSTGGG